MGQAINPSFKKHQTPREDKDIQNAGSNDHQLDLSKLPQEVQLMILQELAIPPPPCLEYHFEDLHEPWNCRECKGIGNDIQEAKTWPITLDPQISTASRFFYEEGYKILYKYHTFVFDRRPKELDSYGLPGATSTSIRDTRAVRLLKFIDRKENASLVPISRLEMNEAHGIPTSDSSLVPTSTDNRITFKNLQSPEEFQASVQHLALIVHIHLNRYMSEEESLDWDWPLKVDWKTLPKLKTLCLDLRGINNHRNFTFGWSYVPIIEEGANRMKCLNLDKLLIVGLCSDEWFHDEDYKKHMEKIFSPALSESGRLEFKDWERFVIW